MLNANDVEVLRDFCIPLVGLLSKWQPDSEVSATGHLDTEFLYNNNNNNNNNNTKIVSSFFSLLRKRRNG
jgi:hypothetical protein